MLHHGSNCLLSQTMDGCIMHCGTTSSCQSAATSKIVKRYCSRVYSCKQRYSKYSDFFYLYCLLIIKLGSKVCPLIPLWICIIEHFCTDILNCHSNNSLQRQLPLLKIAAISLINSTNKQSPTALSCTTSLLKSIREDRNMSAEVCEYDSPV